MSTSIDISHLTEAQQATVRRIVSLMENPFTSRQVERLCQRRRLGIIGWDELTKEVNRIFNHTLARKQT